MATPAPIDASEAITRELEAKETLALEDLGGENRPRWSSLEKRFRPICRADRGPDGYRPSAVISKREQGRGGEKRKAVEKQFAERRKGIRGNSSMISELKLRSLRWRQERFGVSPSRRS